jgi:O-antigen/teichoic acid export membrane protein
VKQPQSAAKRVVMNTGILYAKMGITMFISLYTTRLILNSLGASDFGIFNIVGGAIAMLGFLNAAMAGATQRFMSYAEGEGNKDNQKNIFNISVVLHFGIAVLLGIVLLSAGYFFFNGILNIPEERMYAARMIYYFMIISTMFTVMTVPYDAVLNAHENMLYYAIVGIIESVLKLAVALIVVYTMSDKLIVYGALMAAISLFVMIIMRVYCHKKYEECVFHPRRYYDKALMKEMTGFAGWNFVGSMSSLGGNYGNSIIVNHFFGVKLNTAIGVGNQLQGQLLAFANNMIKALNPLIIKKEGEGERGQMIKYSLVGCKYSFLLFAFFAIPFLIETPLLLKLWLKQVPEWTVLFFRLMLIRTLLEQLTIFLETSISAHGNIKLMNIYSCIFNLFPIPILCILFSLHFPPYWMYIIAILFMVFGLNGSVLYLCHKQIGFQFRDFFRNVISPCFTLFSVTFLFSCLPSAFFYESIIRIIITVCISIVTFMFLFYYRILTVEQRMHYFNEIINYGKSRFFGK